MPLKILKDVPTKVSKSKQKKNFRNLRMEHLSISGAHKKMKKKKKGRN
jgi:hypothetical protein